MGNKHITMDSKKPLVSGISRDNHKVCKKMGDKEELLQVIDERFTRLEEKFDRFIGRIVAMVAITVTIFLFVIGGAFAFSSRVDNELKEVSKCLTKLETDVRDMDGALAKQFPDSAVFGEANKRLRKTRGE
jgi:hypothetical protein